VIPIGRRDRHLAISTIGGIGVTIRCRELAFPPEKIVPAHEPIRRIATELPKRQIVAVK
jgi:hypothetical protein